jgi:hypothetical protein
MNDKTEELKDIFMDVSDEDTVTETQAETRGSLVDVDEEAIEADLLNLVERMREQYDFGTDLTVDDYAAIAREFYDGHDDEEIADSLELAQDTVYQARLDLHLLGEDDTDSPVDRSQLRQRSDVSDATLAEEFDVSEAELRRQRRVAATEAAAARASRRYQNEFDELLSDADLTSPITDAMQEDGLDGATEGLESNVSF